MKKPVAFLLDMVRQAGISAGVLDRRNTDRAAGGSLCGGRLRAFSTRGGAPFGTSCPGHADRARRRGSWVQCRCAWAVRGAPAPGQAGAPRSGPWEPAFGRSALRCQGPLSRGAASPPRPSGPLCRFGVQMRGRNGNVAEENDYLVDILVDLGSATLAQVAVPSASALSVRAAVIRLAAGLFPGRRLSPVPSGQRTIESTKERRGCGRQRETLSKRGVAASGFSAQTQPEAPREAQSINS
jgi:hypothetical protein